MYIYPYLTCNSSSVRFSPSSFATLLRFLNEILPCEQTQQQQTAQNWCHKSMYFLIFLSPAACTLIRKDIETEMPLPLQANKVQQSSFVFMTMSRGFYYFIWYLHILSKPYHRGTPFFFLFRTTIITTCKINVELTVLSSSNNLKALRISSLESFSLWNTTKFTLGSCSLNSVQDVSKVCAPFCTEEKILLLKVMGLWSLAS